MKCTMIAMKARPTGNRLQRDLGYDLIGLSAPTMLMPCSLVPWFQEYEVQLGGTREIILCRSRLRSCEAMGMEAADPILMTKIAPVFEFGARDCKKRQLLQKGACKGR